MLAIDVDPDAVAAARKNADANGCADRITVVLPRPRGAARGGALARGRGQLLAHAHLALAAHYARLAAPGGAG